VQENDQIRRYYQTLYESWGRQHWWPAESQFEVIAGAYLTQNTSWINVERALNNLRNAQVLSVSGIRCTPLPKLERLIRSAGYFRQKARRLKMFVRFLDEHHRGSLRRMFAKPTVLLREELLGLEGIGPETADSILLYAGNHPVFVVDAYTRRILERHDLVSGRANYEEIRSLVERALAPCTQTGFLPAPIPTGSVSKVSGPPGSCHIPSRMSTATRAPLVQVFNEMHGLIVGVGKSFCKKSQPECERCPLQRFLPAPR